MVTFGSVKEREYTLIEQGEYVLTPEATRRYEPLLELLNRTSMGKQERQNLPGRDRLADVRRQRAGLPPSRGYGQQGWPPKPAKDRGPRGNESGLHRLLTR